jgi:CHASE3 domain sensor protein
MKIQIPLNGKVQLAFGSAIFVLLAVGMVSIFGMAASVESKKWVRHTLLVLEELQDLTSSMQTIEDDYRGFVITGDEIYLRSYREATMDIEQDEASIRVLTADNPVQQNRLPSLEKFAAQKMQFGESVIGLRRDRGLDSAMDAIDC